MAIFNVVAHLTTPLAGSLARAPGFNSTVLNGDMDFLDLSCREVGGLTQCVSDVTKDALRGISSSQAVRTAIEGLTLCL